MKTKSSTVVRVESIAEAEYEANAAKMHRSKWEWISNHRDLRELKPAKGITYFIYIGLDQAEVDTTFGISQECPA